MTVTVHTVFAVKPTVEWDNNLGSWLAPHVTAGSTGPFPAPSDGNFNAYREWDTVENAQAYIDYLMSFHPAVITSSTIA